MFAATIAGDSVNGVAVGTVGAAVGCGGYSKEGRQIHALPLAMEG